MYDNFSISQSWKHSDKKKIISNWSNSTIFHAPYVFISNIILFAPLGKKKSVICF